MIGFWNEDEDAALQGLSMEAQIIYLRGIRRFADKNGVAGIERRINRASLSEVCHFMPQRRSPRPESRPTWDQVRHRLNELESSGLIVQKPNLVFLCPLSVQMKTACRRHVDATPMATPKTTRSEVLQHNGFDDVDDTEDGLKTPPPYMDVDATTSPITNHHNISLSNARGKTAEVVTLKRGIPSDFKASPAVKSWCVHRGIGDPTPYLDHFINTCQANGYQYADHDAAFKKAIADDWAGVRKQVRQGNGGRSSSRVPDNSDTSWMTDDLLEPTK